ncbi:hypothetical protein ACYSNW_01390 [Enterococcus sp. LJL99]
MRKFQELSREEKREVANSLSLFLLSIFGQDTYLTVHSLREDFKRFNKQSFFVEIINDFESKNQVDVHFLLKPYRWKVCEVCYRPFLAFDNGNHQTLCRYGIYIKYTKNGRAVNTTRESQCCVIKKQQRSLTWTRKNKKEREHCS